MSLKAVFFPERRLQLILHGVFEGRLILLVRLFPFHVLRVLLGFLVPLRPRTVLQLP